MRASGIVFGVIGAGNMGEAILRGYFKSGNASDVATCIFDPDTEKCRALERSLAVKPTATLEALIEQSDILLIYQRMVDHRDRILPDELFLWNLRTKITSTWTHITMCQLEPCPCKCISKLFRVFVESS